VSLKSTGTSIAQRNWDHGTGITELGSSHNDVFRCRTARLRLYQPGSGSPLLRLKINIFVDDWWENFFGFRVYWLVLGATPPRYFRSFGMNTLADILARSLGNKDLEVKSLFLKDLSSFAPWISGLELLPPLRPGVGPPFHPEQKVKLDRSEATEAVLFFPS
jgi:hypothetical protein